MFASEELISALNTQIGNEMQASLQYTSIACYLDTETLPELAGVFYDQADEERTHAMRFARFIVDVGGRVRIPALEAPVSDFESAEACVELSLAGETAVTEQVNDLVILASSESTHVALRFLDYFVVEQLEEVNKMASLLTLIRRAGSAGLHFVEDYLSRKKASI